MAGTSNIAPGRLVNKTKFVSQELSDDINLNWYQFRYRNFDLQIGRFVSIDPLANNYSNNTPYSYAENKVINGIDLEGLEYLRTTIYTVNMVLQKDGGRRYETTQLGNSSLTSPEGATWSGEKQNTKFIDNHKMYDYQSDIPGWNEFRQYEQEKFNRQFMDGVTITAGIVSMLASGGATAPGVVELLGITSGTMALGGGTTKLIFDSKGLFDKSDKIPTNTIEGTLGLIIEYTSNDKSGVFRAGASVVDGVITLNLKSIAGVRNLINASDKGLTITGITVSSVELYKDAKKKYDQYFGEQVDEQRKKRGSILPTDQ
jgi:RHS repeat-associated protein